MSRLAEYLLQNEEIHKRDNERVLRLEIPKDYVMLLRCECGDDECTDSIEATVAEWEALHKKGLTFMTAPHHYFPRFERVIKKTPTFWVVKKRRERLSEQARA